MLELSCENTTVGTNGLKKREKLGGGRCRRLPIGNNR